MMKKKGIFMAVIFCFLWANAGSETGPKESGIIDTSFKPGNEENLKISEWEALDLMYAHENDKPYSDPEGKDCINYHPTTAEARQFEERFREELHNLTAHVVAIFPFRQDHLDKCFVFTEIKPKESFDCHACTPALGGAIFLKRGDHWQLQIKQPFITYIGSWGYIPDTLKFVKVGEDRYGILIERSYLVHGISDAYTILISQINTRLNVLWESTTYKNNEGDCGEGTDHECYQWSSQIYFKPGSNSSFYDLIVTKSGTKLVDENDSDSKVISFQKTTTYVFSHTTYVVKK